MAEAELSYAGMNSLARAKLAADIVLERMQKSGFNGEIRRDIIGAFSVLDGGDGQPAKQITCPLTAITEFGCPSFQLIRTLHKLCDELQHLYCSGPAAGGGYRSSVTPQMASASILLNRTLIEPHIAVEVVDR